MNDITDSMTLSQLRNNMKNSVDMNKLLSHVNKLNSKISKLSEEIELIGHDM